MAPGAVRRSWSILRARQDDTPAHPIPASSIARSARTDGALSLTGDCLPDQLPNGWLQGGNPEGELLAGVF